MASYRRKMTDTLASFDPVSFSDLPKWAADDHTAAFQAFRASAKRLMAAASRPSTSLPPYTQENLLALCNRALEHTALSSCEACAFFQDNFVPHRVTHGEPDGLLTGYYEPELAASRLRDETYQVPIYRRPPDLINLVDESERGAKSSSFTHARKTPEGWEPFATRQQIEQGALDGKGLELFFLTDPVDVFFMQVQGSGQLCLPDGSKTHITYDGKNGHPYTSVGRYLVDQGLFPAEKMSLEALADWLRSDPQQAQRAMWQNNSYVFFRELAPHEGTAPFGVQKIPLIRGRSLAVDTAYHQIGSPIYVTSPTLRHAKTPAGFNRLMIAHDVGSAIIGPERGDLFFGTGEHAGKSAGITLHRGNFFVLLPKQPSQ